MERKFNPQNQASKKDKRKQEQSGNQEFFWVSYSEDSKKNKEDKSPESLLERSNRFAL